jgi:hypothetical protein
VRSFSPRNPWRAEHSHPAPLHFSATASCLDLAPPLLIRRRPPLAARRTYSLHCHIGSGAACRAQLLMLDAAFTRLRHHESTTPTAHSPRGRRFVENQHVSQMLSSNESYSPPARLGVIYMSSLPLIFGVSDLGTGVFSNFIDSLFSLRSTR